MKKFLLMVAAALMSFGTASAKNYEPDKVFSTLAEIGTTNFYIVNTADETAVYGSGAQNVGVSGYSAATEGAVSTYQLKQVEGNNYLLVCKTPAGADYNIWGTVPSYLNAQPSVGGVTFILGLNNQNGQDMKDGAVWTIEEVAGGFTLKCVGNNGYLAGNKTSADPVVWQFCTLKEKPLIYEVGDDITEALTNPHFRTNDVSAWNMNGKSSPSVDTGNHDCEFFQKDFNMSMTLKGMKKGTYEIGMQAFQRPGNASADMYNAYKAGTCASIAQLYTTAMETEVPNIMAEASTTLLWGEDNGNHPNDSKFVVDGTTYYVPNSMQGARKWFDAGHYNTTAKAVVTEDGGDLTFGFKGKNVGGGWILFDNFTLRYISEDVLVDAAESEKLIAKVPTAKMGTAAKTALDAAVAALDADKTNGSLYNDLKDAVAAAEASVAYYATVAPYVEMYDNFSEAAKAAVTAPAPSIIADYKSGSLNEAAFADVNAMINSYLLPGLRVGVKVAPAAGDDLTVLIENPSFETGNRNGWTDNSAANMWTMMTRANAGDPKVGNYWIEKYGVAGKIDLSQTLTGMPGGTYRLSVVSLDQADVTKLVANDQEAAITGGSASTFSVDVVVPANGELKLGIYCESHPGNKWVGLDDFHLTYVAPLPIEAELSGIQIQDLSAIGSDGSVVVGYDVEGNEFTFVFDGDGNYDSAYLYTVNDEDCYASKGTATFALTEEGKVLEATVTFTDGADFEETYHVTGLVAFDKATMAVSAEAKYGTFVAPFDVTIPADVTAYVVEDVDEVSLVLTDITEMGVDYIPAYTPVVLNAEAGLNETAKGFTVPIDEDTPIEFGLLTGVLKDTPAPVGSYVLQNQAAGVGFYKVEGVQPTVKANRAYLNASSAVKAFTMGEATAIKTLEALTAGKAQIFDMNGRQINKLQKGINIVNGVKVLVK